MFNLGPLELMAIFIVALLVFGPEKLPEIGRQVGRAVREFRRIQSSFQADLGDALDGHLNGPVLPGPGPAEAAPATPPPDSGPLGDTPLPPGPVGDTPLPPGPVGDTPLPPGPVGDTPLPPGPGPEVSPPGDAAAKSEGKPPDAHQG